MKYKAFIFICRVTPKIFDFIKLFAGRLNYLALFQIDVYTDLLQDTWYRIYLHNTIAHISFTAIKDFEYRTVSKVLPSRDDY